MEKQRPHCPSSTCLLDPLLPIWILLLALFASIKSYGPLGTARPGGPMPGPPPRPHLCRLRSWNPREQSFRSPCPSLLLSPSLSLIPVVPRYQVSQKDIQVSGLRATRRLSRPCALRPSVGLWQDQLWARGQGSVRSRGAGGSPEWEVLGRPG